MSTLEHVIIYGQSLSLGSNPSGGYVVSAPQPSHRRFNAGVRCHYDRVGNTNPNTPIWPQAISDLVPLEESVSTTWAQFGETVASGIASRLDSETLLSVTGRGAYTVDRLSRNAGVEAIHFVNTHATVVAASELARTAGKEYAIKAIVWKQGEADARINTPRVAYKEKVLRLHADFRRHLQLAALVDTSALALYTDQMGYQYAGWACGEIALAAIELHRESGGQVLCVGPSYVAEYHIPTDVHLSSIGYRHRGDLFGKAIAAGAGWRPCHIKSVSRDGAKITVQVHTPVPPLVVDTTLVAAVASHGFRYSSCAISAVNIVCPSAGIVEITLAAAMSGTLSVALENGTNQRAGSTLGPRANLRDSDPATSHHDGFPLYNWLCVDRWEVA